MTTSEKKEAVRQAIIKVVPGIMDLKFGCEVWHKNYKNGREIEGLLSQGKLTIKTGEWYQDQFGNSFNEKGITEIIGRPIQLQDVLVATEKRWRTMYGVNPIDGLKRDIPLREGEMLYYIVSKWDLSQDFDHQSEAVWEFLWKLLVNEK